MIVECQKCGAPLSVVEGQRLAQCTYCGATSQARSQRTTAQPVAAPPPPPVWQQPPPPPQTAYAYQPMPAPRASSGGAGCVLGVVIALALAGVGAGVYVGGRGSFFATSVDPNAPPSVATVALAAGAPVARTFPAVAGGPVRGSTLGTTCRGYYAAAPQFSLRVAAMQRVRLTTLGSNDLTMAVRVPGGLYRCDDDSGQGTNPLLDLTLPPGVYPVFVGAYRQNTTASFTLDLQAGEPGALPIDGALAFNLPASLGALALVGPTSTDTRAGIAGGAVDATPLGSNCRGHLPAAPHLTLTTSDYRRVVLTTTATRDLTMVVRDAAGVLHCDDDSGGAQQPRVEATLPPGQHQVWVGTYSAGETESFALTVRSESAGTGAPLATGLAPQAAPTAATLDLDRAPSTALRGTIAGAIEARRVSPSCTGWVTAAPQLRLLTRTPRHVTIAATSSGDLTLLARGPNGDVVCVDDSNGSPNPTLDADIGAGETTVWIGSYRGSSRVSYRVQVTAQAPSGALPVK
ncbi:MAG: hypothetical protein JWM10_415 [Myxococcaceae bacterium]|nr:hypothetical protein [Myxococcaceae bacterium]